MRISGVIGLIILSSGILLAAGIIINDFETSYVSTNISQATPVDQNLSLALVNQTQLNDTFVPLYKNLDDLKSQEGFLDFLSDGAIVLATLFVTFITSFPIFVGIGVQQITLLSEFVGIPIELIFFIITSFIVWFIFKAVEQFRRYPT